MAATAATPALAVAQAAFCRLDCDHPQLFQTEYKRSNRTKGLKILRCFPHCCPEHIDRSYCGTSLSVRVHVTAVGGDADASASAADRVALFARFEAVSDVSLREGECVEVDKIHAGVQTEANLEGQWIPGQLDRPSGLVAAIRTASQPPSDEKPVVFHLNAKAFSRWYYDWESGANKAQRLMKHVLKAYVVERCAVDGDGNFTSTANDNAQTQLYRVIAVVVSPEFTVISYRRAPTDPASGMPLPQQSPSGALVQSHHRFVTGQRELYRGDPAVISPRYAADRRPSSGGRLDDHAGMNMASAGASTSASSQWAGHGQPYFESGGRSPAVKRVRGSPYDYASVRDFERQEPEMFEQKSLWSQSRAPDAVVTSKNLALLYSFVQWAPLSVYTSFVDELVHLVQHKLLDPVTGSHHAGRINCFSRVLLEHASPPLAGAPATTPTASGGASSGGGAASAAAFGQAIPYDVETLLRATSQAVLWVFSRETREWIQSFLAYHAPAVLDKHSLRDAYLLLLRELEERLDTQVFAPTPFRNVAIAAEEVIASVYSLELFHDKRPQVRQILSAQGFMGWNAFVAQMREAFISSGDKAAGRHPTASSVCALFPPRTAMEHYWTGEWLLDTEDASWRPTHPPVDANLSLFAIFSLISQYVRVQVALSMRERVLCVRSTEGIAGRLDSTRFILDGRERVFRFFPDGISSSMRDGAGGDYVGVVQREGEDRLIVYLQLFTWAVQDGQPSYYTRLRIECWHDQRLYVNGEVLETVAPSSFVPEEWPYVAEMRLRGKRKALNKAHQRYFRSAGVASSGSSPWRELGKFRMSYSKL